MTLGIIHQRTLQSLMTFNVVVTVLVFVRDKKRKAI